MMERRTTQLRRIQWSTLFCYMYLFRLNECLDIIVKHGAEVVFELPGIKTCGQFSLLDPTLRPVFVVEGNNATNLISPYDKRASVVKTEVGFKLSISHAKDNDAGTYKVATSSVTLSPPCVTESFYVTVLEATDVHMEPWEEWSFCISQCSPSRHRSRSRKCSVKGSCTGLGPMFETETCDKAAHCPKWSSWGSWGSCSAKCGKGFKIRKRACLSGNSSLVKSSECRGISTQSHMCLTVCEFGTWTHWSEWSNCSQSCDNDSSSRGTRTRNRSCSTDSGQRVVAKNCTGNRTEEEFCKIDCTHIVSTPSQNITETIHVQSVADDTTESTFSIIPVVAGVTCALIIIVVLIIVLVLKTRVHRRRGSAPTLRPADAAHNRRKKLSKERRSDAPRDVVEPESGNVYSELNSSFQYPSSEFDSVYSIDNPGFQKSSAVNVMETIRDDEEDADDVSDGYDSDFDDNPEVTGRATVCERKEIIYAKSRASCQRVSSQEERKYSDSKSMESEDYVVTENECYEPPELWSNDDVRHSFGTNASNNDVTSSNDVTCTDEMESIYYEPPVESEEDDASRRAELKRQESEMNNESIYENCEAKRGTIRTATDQLSGYDQDDYYEIPENRQVVDEPENDSNEDIETPNLTQVNMRNGSIVTIDERYPHISKEDLDGDHTYVNEKVNNDAKDYYVTPKYTYGTAVTKKKVHGKEHIYDIPKFDK